METKVNFEEFLFLQSTTSRHHFVGKDSNVKIESKEVINNETCYYIRWEYGGRSNYNWFSINHLHFICNAHKQWLGKDSHSFIKWNKILQDIEKGSI